MAILELCHTWFDPPLLTMFPSQSGVSTPLKLAAMAPMKGLDTDLAKFQRVQNRLARVVTKSPPFTRSVPLLRSLHWLPVNFRVDFKICLLTYKTLSEKHPVYLHSLLATPLPSRSLR